VALVAEVEAAMEDLQVQAEVGVEALQAQAQEEAEAELEAPQAQEEEVLVVAALQSLFPERLVLRSPFQEMLI
jgi:hypothetical protein